MLILTAVSIWHAVIAFLIGINQKRFDINLVERYVLIGMAIVYGLFNLCFIFAINNRAISRRRDMVRLDEEYRRVLLARSRTKQQIAPLPLQPSGANASAANNSNNLTNVSRPFKSKTYQNPVIQVDEH